MNFAIAVDVQRTVKVENVFKFKSLILKGSLEKIQRAFCLKTSKRTHNLKKISDTKSR